MPIKRYGHVDAVDMAMPIKRYGRIDTVDMAMSINRYGRVDTVGMAVSTVFPRLGCVILQVRSDEQVPLGAEKSTLESLLKSVEFV